MVLGRIWYLQAIDLNGQSFNYYTVLIHINVLPEIAIHNVNNRVKNGGHGETLNDNEIITSNLLAKRTYDYLKTEWYVDNYEEIINS